METTEKDTGQNGLGSIGGVVLDLAPELGRWLFGPDAGAVSAIVRQALARATGAEEPDQQLRALSDPEKAGALRIDLARICAEQAAAATARGHSALLASLSQAAHDAGAPPVTAPPGIAYGAPLISLVVLLTFAIVVVVALTRTMPQGAEPVLNVLLGTLGAMATSVVGYWVGSSAGSARKEERLASLAERS